MAPYIGTLGHDRLIAAITRLHRLADDLARIAREDMPTPEELEGTPILDRYSVAETRLECLIGTQPGSGRILRTSELYFVAPEQGWARTMSRFYRLGRPARNSQGSGMA